MMPAEQEDADELRFRLSRLWQSTGFEIWYDLEHKEDYTDAKAADPFPVALQLAAWRATLVYPPDAGVITYDVVDWPVRAMVAVGVIATADVWIGVSAATLTGLMGAP